MGGGGGGGERKIKAAVELEEKNQSCGRIGPPRVIR